MAGLTDLPLARRRGLQTDQLDRHRSRRLENKPLAHPRCSKTPSIRPNTSGNRQTQVSVRTTGEKGGSLENTVLNPLHRVQSETHAKGRVENSISYIQKNFLNGLEISSLEALNAQVRR